MGRGIERSGQPSPKKARLRRRASGQIGLSRTPVRRSCRKRFYSIPLEASLPPLLATFSTPSPAAPALRPTPSETAPQIVSAPVPPRTMPTVGVKAVPPTLVYELRFLQDAETISSHTDAVKAAGCRLGIPDE